MIYELALRGVDTTTWGNLILGLACWCNYDVYLRRRINL
nr:hypothetical protein BAR15_120375 [Bartonella sp. AR 15-3]